MLLLPSILTSVSPFSKASLLTKCQHIRATHHIHFKKP
uniref:Uncharacterized protein n=1 Tax=Anguilla anguilla TaxID=7936 RepID=A0A0E9V220_ANGAN